MARLEALDWSAMTEAERDAFERHRRDCLELRDSMTDEAIQAELEATIHAGRNLTSEEVRAIRTRQ